MSSIPRENINILSVNILHYKLINYSGDFMEHKPLLDGVLDRSFLYKLNIVFLSKFSLISTRQKTLPVFHVLEVKIAYYSHICWQPYNILITTNMLPFLFLCVHALRCCPAAF